MKNWILMLCFLVSFSAIGMSAFNAGRETTWWTSLSHMTILSGKLAASWMLYFNAASLEERLSRREEKREDLGVLQRDKDVFQAGIAVVGVDFLLSVLLFASNQQKKDNLSAGLGFIAWTPWLVNTVMTGVSLQSVKHMCQGEALCWTSDKGEPSNCSRQTCPDESTFKSWRDAWIAMAVFSGLVNSIQICGAICLRPPVES